MAEVGFNVHVNKKEQYYTETEHLLIYDFNWKMQFSRCFIASSFTNGGNAKKGFKKHCRWSDWWPPLFQKLETFPLNIKAIIGQQMGIQTPHNLINGIYKRRSYFNPERGVT